MPVKRNNSFSLVVGKFVFQNQRASDQGGPLTEKGGAL